MGLIKFFAEKSIFVNLTVIFVLLIGIFTFSTTAKEVFPQIKIGYLVIMTSYPQSGPEEIENLITIPIENAVEGIQDIKEITSWTSEGLSMIGIELLPEVEDVDQVLDEVKSEVDKITDFPAEAEDPEIFEISTDFFPLINLSISGGNSYAELRETADRLEDKLEKIDGVGNIIKEGYYDKAIWVDADKKKLDDYGLTLFNFISVLQDRDISMPAGNKVMNNQEYALRMLLPMETVDDVKRVIIRSNELGNKVRVRDVAQVTDGFKDEDMYTRSQGQRSILMQVQKQKGFDTIAMVEGIRKLVAEEKKSMPPDVNVAFANDMSIYLKNRLNVLYSNGLFGGLLVIIMLILLLRPAVALWTAMGMPVAFAGAFYLAKLFNIDTNMISILGYIMVLGMIVDDAIVVGENVYRHIEEGLQPFDAAVKGASEMLLPVIASVSTTIAAFLPLMLVGGMMGEFLSAIPKVIIIALVASLIECFFILPAHLADFVKPAKAKAGETKQEHWFALLREGYGKVLHWVLYHRLWFAVIIIVLFGVSIFLGTRNGLVFTDAQSQQIKIQLKTDKNYSLDDTEAIVVAMEKQVLRLDDQDLDVVNSYVGMLDDRHGPPRFGPNKAQLDILLHIEDERKTKKAEAIVNQLRQWIGQPEGVEDITIEVMKGGPPTGAAIDINLAGEAYEALLPIAKSLAQDIRDLTMPEKRPPKKGEEPAVFKPVKEIKHDFEEGKREIRLIIDEEKATLAGVNLGQASTILRAAIAGIKLKTIKKLGEDIDVMVRVNENSLAGLQEILNLRIPNRFGNRILLKEIVRVEQGQSTGVLKHQDGKKSIGLIGSIDQVKTNVNAVNQKIAGLLKDYRAKFKEISFEVGGEQQEMMEGFMDLAKAFAVAFLLIFIILATLFNSVIQPVIIMLAIPFGFIGVMLTLFFHDMPISFMAFMGFIGLTGVVVNDSLILVSFINNMAKQGVRLEQAIMDGAKTRLRPVVLTTVTTSVGLFPLAYGWFGGDEPMIAPMALVFAWGLIFATIVTLFIIPSFVAIVHNMKVIFFRMIKQRPEMEFIFKK